MLNFLTTYSIMDLAGLNEKLAAMLGEQLDIGDKLKPVGRRLPVLKKHLEQTDIYLKFKGKKSLKEAEQIRRSVYDILRREEREQQPRKEQEVDR